MPVRISFAASHCIQSSFAVRDVQWVRIVVLVRWWEKAIGLPRRTALWNPSGLGAIGRVDDLKVLQSVAGCPAWNHLAELERLLYLLSRNKHPFPRSGENYCV